MAEREGFEPSIEFPLYTLSKRAPSTTRPSLRFRKARASLRIPRDGSRLTISLVPQPISRRVLLASAALATCQKPKATGILGYCFVANQISRSVAVVDLSRFRVRTRIPLDAAPAQIVAPPKPARAYALAPDAATVYEIDAV